MPDHDDLVTLFPQARDLKVHLGDQRAGGVIDVQCALGGFDTHRLRYAMGAEDEGRAIGHVG